MGLFKRRKELPKSIDPVEVETEDRTPEAEEEPEADWRITQAIKHIEEGKRCSASLQRGSSGLTMYYEIKSAKDGAVCECCKEMEGQKFMFENAILGVNYPPFDCCKNGKCRCMALSRMK